MKYKYINHFFKNNYDFSTIYLIYLFYLNIKIYLLIMFFKINFYHFSIIIFYLTYFLMFNILSNYKILNVD